MTLKLFARIISETFLWVALFGGVLGLLTGVALIFNSALVVRLSEKMNVWISTREAMQVLERPIEIERTVYRWHRLIGALILAGALFTLYVLLWRFNGPQVVDALTKLLELGVAKWVAESVRVFFVLVNVAALVIAVVMIVRPSSLKGVEAWANRQYTPRRSVRAFDIPRVGPDSLVRTRPRLLGMVLALAGLYVVFSLGSARFFGH